jgi:acetyl esterase
MQEVLDRLAVEDAGLGDPTLLPAAEGRALAARTNRRWNVDQPAMAEVRALDVAARGGRAIRCRLLLPEAAEPGLILFVHGGGFAFCSMATHERAARLLAVEAGVAVLTFDYRLAPEDPFPAGLEDTVAVLRNLASGAEWPVPRGPLGIGGDSAGANLALAAMLREQRAGRPLPDVGLLFYGVYDADFGRPSYLQSVDGPGLTRDKMRRYWDWYVPDPARRADPLAAPLRAEDDALAALPPLYLNAAGIDPLLSESEALHARLQVLGRDDPFTLFPGVVHGFMQMTTVLAAARTATAEAGAAFRKLAGLTQRTRQTAGGDAR